MTHEPECNLLLLDELNRPKFPQLPSICNCEQIRAAYQRGREDERKEMQYDLILGPTRGSEYTLGQNQDTLLGDEKQWSQGLTAAVEESAYNCDCQIGGVDAMSIDTDWLTEAARAFSKTISAIDRIRDLHKPYKMSHLWTACEVCRELPSERGRDYPCPTIRALDGEQNDLDRLAAIEQQQDADRG